ncbi:GNAT family N-acetyltransferase [Jiella sp. MQZ9-1]|uniref:GNAT family N-acetyltransferase n=1 Tax=Jiella flava TaxID=2816857 RepID=A0A939FVM4_9HYPH|nr:GNAT family N-acetyltransferase [Jiella flava]MBO0661091.1 GNAT family N-acetyltransferase [Jiella flava]MCD2469738.1 GNAT family N-acetyltransferase [Jiella flava]
MFFEVFTTARLKLRPLIQQDTRAIFEGYARAPQIMRYMTWRPHNAIGETEAFVARSIAAEAARTYAIVEHDAPDLCGVFTLRRPEAHRLGFGYVLAKPFWGRGYISEVLTTVADWALHQDGIWRIADICDVDNHASARVMEKAGFLRDGVLRRYRVRPNLSTEPRDSYLYARTR